MTKHYNNQRRDDTQRSSRHFSSDRRAEERFSRPRLNRETVDRAWESGAQPNHADYRARNNNGQPARNNRRYNQYSNTPPAQNSQNNRSPYGNRQNNNRYSERTPYGDQNSRSRSLDSDRRNFNEQGYGERRNYSGGQGSHQGSRYQNRSGYPNARPQSRNRYSNEGYPQQNFDRNSRPSGNFDRDQRSQRNFERGNQDSRNYRGRGTQNPRYQSRPWAQRERFSGRQDFNERRPQNEQFEGDYESYNTYEAPHYRHERYSDDSGRAERQAEERPVTRLPDGRVLKGPRPVQRKNAQFWTDIDHEAGDLLSEAGASPISNEVNAQPIETPPSTHEQGKKPKAAAKTRTRRAGARERKTRTKSSTSKTQPRGLKPSQRGFKWPTREE